jgi:hypothetical protein
MLLLIRILQLLLRLLPLLLPLLLLILHPQIDPGLTLD